jgi:hypothetical protein
MWLFLLHFPATCRKREERCIEHSTLWRGPYFEHFICTVNRLALRGTAPSCIEPRVGAGGGKSAGARTVAQFRRKPESHSLLFLSLPCCTGSVLVLAKCDSVFIKICSSSWKYLFKSLSVFYKNICCWPSVILGRVWDARGEYYTSYFTDCETSLDEGWINYLSVQQMQGNFSLRTFNFSVRNIWINFMQELLSVNMILMGQYKEMRKHIAFCVSVGRYPVSRTRWRNIIPQILEWISIVVYYDRLNQILSESVKWLRRLRKVSSVPARYICH